MGDSFGQIAQQKSSVDELYRNAADLDSAKAIPNAQGIYNIRLGNRIAQVTETELERIRRNFRAVLTRGINHVDGIISSGMEGHKHQAKVRSEFPIVSRVSDVFGRVSYPELSIWNKSISALKRARILLPNNNRFYDTVKTLIIAGAEASEAYRRFHTYWKGTISGAERAVTTLEWTRDISFATAGVMATIATGGVGGALIGTGVATTGNIAQQGMEVHLGLRDRIDWAGVGFDALFGLVTSFVGGKFGNKLVGKVLRHPGIRRLVTIYGEKAVKGVVGNIISGKTSSSIQIIARNIFDQARGANRASTVEEFINRLGDQLATNLVDPKSILVDTLSGKVARGFAGRTPPKQTRLGATAKAKPSSVSAKPAPKAQQKIPQTKGTEKPAIQIPPTQKKAPVKPSAQTRKRSVTTKQKKQLISAKKVPKTPKRAISSRRPRGFETGRHKPGRRVRAGGLEGLEPTIRPTAKIPRRKRITRQEQLEGISPKKLGAPSKRRDRPLKGGFEAKFPGEVGRLAEKTWSNVLKTPQNPGVAGGGRFRTPYANVEPDFIPAVDTKGKTTFGRNSGYARKHGVPGIQDSLLVADSKYLGVFHDKAPTVTFSELGPRATSQVKGMIWLSKFTKSKTFVFLGRPGQAIGQDIQQFAKSLGVSVSIQTSPLIK